MCFEWRPLCRCPHVVLCVNYVLWGAGSGVSAYVGRRGGGWCIAAGCNSTNRFFLTRSSGSRTIFAPCVPHNMWGATSLKRAVVVVFGTVHLDEVAATAEKNGVGRHDDQERVDVNLETAHTPPSLP